jgi:hypothetical protein
MSRYTHFTKLKHLIFLNGGSTNDSTYAIVIAETCPSWHHRRLPLLSLHSGFIPLGMGNGVLHQGWSQWILPHISSCHGWAISDLRQGSRCHWVRPETARGSKNVNKTSFYDIYVFICVHLQSVITLITPNSDKVDSTDRINQMLSSKLAWRGSQRIL